MNIPVSTLTATRTVQSSEQTLPRWRAVCFDDLVFGLLPVLALAPICAFEFSYAWTRVHLRLFPLPILIVLGFVWIHWKSKRSESIHRMVAAHALQMGVFVLLFACWWMFSPWMAHLSLVPLFAGWALLRLGDVPWQRVAAWSLLLATSLRWPGDLDIQLMEWVEHIGTEQVAMILDGLSQPYLLEAGRLSVSSVDPSQLLELNIVATVRSALSWNALACLSILISILRHRSLLVSVVMFLMTPGWYLVMVILQLLAIVLASHGGKLELSVGWFLIGLSSLNFVLAAWMLWLTERFVASMLKPVPPYDGEFETEFRSLNRLLLWPQPDPFASSRTSSVPPRRRPTSPVWIRVHWIMRRVCLGTLCLGLVASLFVTTRAFATARNVAALPRQTAARLHNLASKECLPGTLGSMQLLDFDETLQRGDGIEQRLLKWRYSWRDQIVQLSVCWPYDSRQDATREFTDLGWQVYEQRPLEQRQLAGNANIGDGTTRDAVAQSTNALEVDLKNEFGGTALALIDVPVVAGTGDPALRYKISMLCESGDELHEKQLETLHETFRSAISEASAFFDARVTEVMKGAK